MKEASNRELNYVDELLFNENIDEAINELRRLRNLYPNDTRIILKLGSSLLRQRKNESEAFYLLSLANNRYNKAIIIREIGSYYLNNGNFEKAEEQYKKLLTGNESDVCYGLHGLIKVYLHTDQYEDAMKCFDRLKVVSDLLDDKYIVPHFNNLRFILCYKNGNLSDAAYGDNYFRQQLLDYSDEKAIEHIKGHLEEYDDNGDIPKTFHSVFCEDINIEKLYHHISEEIKNRKPDSYDIVDYYRYDFKRKIGESYSHIETSVVEVITFANSKNILSIYPVFDQHINKVTTKREEPKKKKNKKYINKNNKKNHK